MNRRLGSKWSTALGLFGLLTACGGDAGMILDGGADAATVYPVDLALPSCVSPIAFATIRSQILPGCAGYGCHHDAPFAGGLDLTDGAAYGSLVNVSSAKMPGLLRVKPGAPADSFLWHKLDNLLSDYASSGQPMPLGAENIWFALPASERAQVYCWILAGAANN